MPDFKMPENFYGSGVDGAIEGAFGVACCGCLKMLDKKGKPRDVQTGFVPRDAIAWFPDHAAADAAAKAAGWQIADAGGPNHRCPACLKLGEQSSRRGAYIAAGDYPAGRL